MTETATRKTFLKATDIRRYDVRHVHIFAGGLIFGLIFVLPAPVAAQPASAQPALEVGSLKLNFSLGEIKEKRGGRRVEIICLSEGEYEEIVLDMVLGERSSGHPDQCGKRPLVLPVGEKATVYLFVQETETISYNVQFRFSWGGDFLYLDFDGKVFAVTDRGLQPVTDDDG